MKVKFIIILLYALIAGLWTAPPRLVVIAVIVAVNSNH